MMLIRATLFLLIPWMMISCRTAKSVVAAVDVKPTKMLPHGSELKENRKRSPFIGNWWTTDKKLQAASDQNTQLYISPVRIDAVRPMQNYLAKVEFSDERRQKKLEELAKYAHKKFVSAFKSAKHPRYTDRKSVV